MILGHRPDWQEYVASCLAVLLGWTLSIPFLLGAIARIDYSGQLTATANIVIGVGLAAGPAISCAIWGRRGSINPSSCCHSPVVQPVISLRYRPCALEREVRLKSVTHQPR